jgi:beta-1,4-mannosyl-glycoprotein beta-1,4-N-acetylglucosaminyltransferase
MSRKIYHASQFFNEIDLLKLKIETEKQYVDHFIISESNFTHSGIEKDYIFGNNKEEFNDYLDKIIYQKINDSPSSYSNIAYDSHKDYLFNLTVTKMLNHNHYDRNINSYLRDSWEKESLLRAMSSCNDDDIIILTDLDEIIKPEAILWLKENFNDDFVYYFDSAVYYYYLNIRKNEKWECPLAMSFKMFKDKSFCYCRNFRNGILIPDSAWHFSYMGGVKNIKNKIESFGEQSLNLSYIKNNLENSVDNCLSSGLDLYGRSCDFWIEPISYNTHPAYLVENKDNFAHMIKVI